MKVASNQAQQLREENAAPAPVSYQFKNSGADYFSGKSGKLGGGIRFGSPLVIQASERVERVERIIDCARKMIELTRVNWEAQGCYRPRLKRHAAHAKQAIPAVQNIPMAYSRDIVGQLDGMSDCPRNMIELRGAAAGLIA